MPPKSKSAAALNAANARIAELETALHGEPQTVYSGPKAVAVERQPIARIAKQVPRHDPFKKSAKDRGLAGTYRVIHGSIAIPRPRSEWSLPDGSENPHEPKVIYAMMGDEIEIGDEDAARMIDADIIEPLDAKPSRVGKVWAPPTPMKNRNAA